MKQDLIARWGLAAVLIGAAAAPQIASAAGTMAPPSFAANQAYPVGSDALTLAIGDVTGDGRNDVLVTTNRQLLVFEQQGDGSLAQTQALDLGPSDTEFGGIAIGDLDGDGAADAVYPTSNGAYVYYQHDGHLEPGELIAGSPTREIQVAIADLNGDGTNDLIVDSEYHGTYLLERTEGDSSYTAKLIGPPLNDPSVGDLNGDGLLDVAGMNGGLSLLLQQRDGSFASQAVTDQWEPDVAVADVTEDGLADVLVAAEGGGLQVYAQRAGEGLSSIPAAYAACDATEAVATADFDADGRFDVAVGHPGVGRVGVFVQFADGSLSEERLEQLPVGGGMDALAIGDLNGDGLPDIAVVNGDSLFVAPQGESTGTQVDCYPPSPPPPPPPPPSPPGPTPTPPSPPPPPPAIPVPPSPPHEGQGVAAPPQIATSSVTTGTTHTPPPYQAPRPRYSLLDAGRFEPLVAPAKVCVNTSSGVSGTTQKRVLACLVSYARRKVGLYALRPNAELRQAAQLKAEAILRCNDFTHNACGKPWWRVFRSSGYIDNRDGYAIGENLAAVSTYAATPRAILRLWLESKNHRENLLGHRWHDFGVAMVRGRLNGTRQAIWALEFGARGRR